MPAQHPWDGKKITKDDYWPCACVLHHKLNHPGVPSCRSCKGKRPEYGKYLCRKCNKLIPRDRDKRFIVTTCQKTGKRVRAYRI